MNHPQQTKGQQQIDEEADITHIACADNDLPHGQLLSDTDLDYVAGGGATLNITDTNTFSMTGHQIILPH